MAKLSSLINYEDIYDLNSDITKTSQSINVFCICCLHQNVPFIKLMTCSHKDFLNTFTTPELKPVNHVICHQCHDMLKKIQRFKQQVEDSMKLLVAQVNNPESMNQRRDHLTKIHRIVDITIPQTRFKDQQTNRELITYDNIKTIRYPEFNIKERIDKQSTENSKPPKSTKDTKMKNIKEALKIIESNKINNDCVNFLTTSLQSITSTRLFSLTAALTNDYNLPVNIKMLSRAGTSNINQKLSGVNNVSNTMKTETEDSTKTLTEVPDNTHDTLPAKVKIGSEGITAFSNNTNKENKPTDNMIKMTVIHKNNDKDDTELPITVKFQCDGIEAVSNNILVNQGAAITDGSEILVEVPNNTILDKTTNKDEIGIPLIVKQESDVITTVSNNKTPEDTEMLIEVPYDTVINKNSDKDETELPVIVKIVSNNTVMSNNTTDDTEMLIEDNVYASTDFEMKEEEIQLPEIVQTASVEASGESNLLESASTIKETQSKLDIAINTVEITHEELMEARSKTAESTSYLKSPHRCESCILGFNYKENYEDHVQRKHTAKQDSVTCEICLQVLQPARYKEHTERHYTRFECVRCGKRFALHEDYLVIDHYRMEHTDLEKCKLCCYVTHSRGKFEIHMKRKHAGTCLSCGDRFKSKYLLKNHIKSMHNNSAEKAKIAPSTVTSTVSRKRSRRRKKVSLAEEIESKKKK